MKRIRMKDTETTDIFESDEISDIGTNKRIFAVSSSDIVRSSTSKGNQQKWFTEGCYAKGKYYEAYKYWGDDIAEVAASDLCGQLGINAVRQNLCDIQLTDDGKVVKVVHGSYSQNFLREEEEFLPFFRLYQASPELSWGPIEEASVRILQTIEIYIRR